MRKAYKTFLAILGVTALAFCITFLDYHRLGNDILSDNTASLAASLPGGKDRKEVGFTKLVYNISTLVTARDRVPDPQHQFKTYNGHGVVTYNHVCFEDNTIYSGVAVDMDHVALTKRIVVYGASKKYEKELHVAASASCDQPRSWPVTFRPGPAPSNFLMLPYPVYFSTASQPGNLYHLLHDTLVGLFGVLQVTNRLNATVRNQVYTRKPHIPFYQARSKNISTYGDLIRALGVRSFPAYHAAPHGVCHEYGVFGWKPVPMHQMTAYFGQYFNFDQSNLCKERTLTFIDRNYRKVTNMDELLDAAKSLNFKVQKVRLERMPLKEQYKTIRCTDVLVGVQGAGLQWVVFMRPKKAMIELAYPGWKFLFADRYKNFNGITTKKISGVQDGAEWRFYEREYNQGIPLTENQKKKGLAAKFSNSKYNVGVFRKALGEIKLN